MRLLLVFLTALTFLTAFGQSSPAKGSPDRTAILEVLRGPIQKDLGQKVQFKVNSLKMQGVWAFINCRPQKPNGKAIDYSKTKYKEALKEGAFDDGIFALFKKKGGKWTMVKYSLGATDVPYVTWPQDFGAPKSIFGMP